MKTKKKIVIIVFSVILAINLLFILTPISSLPLLLLISDLEQSYEIGEPITFSAFVLDFGFSESKPAYWIFPENDEENPIYSHNSGYGTTQSPIPIFWAKTWNFPLDNTITSLDLISKDSLPSGNHTEIKIHQEGKYTLHVWFLTKDAYIPFEVVNSGAK